MLTTRRRIVLHIYRGHQKSCPHRSKGRSYRHCGCVVWVDGSIDGDRYCKSLGTRNWQVAADLVREIEVTGAIAQEAPAPEPVTVSGACENYMNDAKARGLREPTLYKFVLLFRRLRAFAAERGLQFIKELDLETVREFRVSLPHRNTSARKRLEELRAFFEFCRQSSWISDNPARKLKPPKTEDPPKEPFTEEEERRIVAACALYPRRGQADAQRVRALVDLLRYSGLRIGDAVTLRRDCLIGDKLRLHTAKTGIVVCCPLPPWVAEELRMVRGTGNEYFFWTGESEPKSCVGDWQRSLKRLFRLAGIPNGHAHRFRHTFAKKLLMAGVTPERVAALLGHRNAAITLRHYAAWVRERQEQLEMDVRRIWELQERQESNQRETLRSARYPLYGGSGAQQVQ